MNLIEIKEDVFDIACRLREIDENNESPKWLTDAINKGKKFIK